MEKRKRIEYLENVISCLHDINEATSSLIQLWDMDTDYDFDLNQMTNYPYTESLDDLQLKVSKWASINIHKLLEQINAL